MALASATIFECRPTGSDTTCSGGFNPQNANFITDGTATNGNTSAPVFSSVSYNFVASDVGAWVFIKSNVAANVSPGWYQIASLSGSNAVLSAAIGAGQLWGGNQGTTNEALSFIPSTLAGISTASSPTTITWGIDYSQQDANKFAYTDLVSVTTTTITSTGHPFGKNCIGNLLRITSGTSWTVQTCEITNVTGTTATVDKTVGGTGLTGGNGYLGGAYAGPQLIGVITVTGNRIFIKAGTGYTMNSSTPSVAGGIFTTATIANYYGYTTTRGDGAPTKPVFTASGISTVTMFTVSAGGSTFNNITVDCATLATMTGFSGITSGSNWYGCIAKNAQTGISGGYARLCVADTCTVGYASARGSYCIAKSCTSGFGSNTLASFEYSISVSCTTGFNPSSGSFLVNCTAYNGTSGFIATGSAIIYDRCLSHTNTTGFSQTSGGNNSLLNCASYNDGAATNFSSATSPMLITNLQTLTADPCVSVSGGNFALNSATGGGALLKNIVQAFPSAISTNSYPDIGGAQSPKATVGY